MRDTEESRLRFLISIGEVDYVENVCRDILRKSPYSIKAMYTMAIAYLYRSKRQDALDLLFKAVGACGNNWYECRSSLLLFCEDVLGKGKDSARLRQILELTSNLPTPTFADSSTSQAAFFRAEALFHLGRKMDAFTILSNLEDNFIHSAYLDAVHELRNFAERARVGFRSADIDLLHIINDGTLNRLQDIVGDDAISCLILSGFQNFDVDQILAIRPLVSQSINLPWEGSTHTIANWNLILGGNFCSIEIFSENLLLINPALGSEKANQHSGERIFALSPETVEELKSLEDTAQRVEPGSEAERLLRKEIGRLADQVIRRDLLADQMSIDVHVPIKGIFNQTRPLNINTLLYNGETELLEIHLENLSSTTDIFIVIEGTRSFTGIAKKLDDRPLKERFGDAFEKVVYIRVGFSSFDFPFSWYPWFIEALHRNAAHRFILENRRFLNVGEHDVHLICDVDEIHTMDVYDRFRALKTQVACCLLQEHKFFFNLRLLAQESNKLSLGLPELSALCYGSVLNEVDPFTIRTLTAREGTRSGRSLIGVGWHFSSLGDAESIARKYASYSHLENDLAARDANFFSILLSCFMGDVASRDLIGKYINVDEFIAVPLTKNYPDSLLARKVKLERFIINPDQDSMTSYLNALQARFQSMVL